MPSLHSNRGAKRAREARAALTDDAAAPLKCVLSVAEDVMETPVVIAELPEAILSDDTIAEMLHKEQGIEVARRTVAKYREGLNIPSSVIRRRQKRAMMSVG